MRDAIAKFSGRHQQLLPQRHDIFHELVQLGLRELILPGPHGRAWLSVFYDLQEIGLRFLLALLARKIGSRWLERLSCRPFALSLWPMTNEAVFLIGRFPLGRNGRGSDGGRLPDQQSKSHSRAQQTKH